MRIIISTLIFSIAFAVLAGLVVIYTGIFNVATAWKDPTPMRWALITIRKNSIRSRAASIKAPPTKGNKQIDEGFRSYREMCAICHTPPGATDSPVTKGLNPLPPDLAKITKQMSSAELFWVIKNGIRMTGMPAWGPTHSDDQLWDIVAFVKTLPDMSGEDYRSLDRRLAKGHSHSGSGHHDARQSKSSHHSVEKNTGGHHHGSGNHKQ